MLQFSIEKSLACLRPNLAAQWHQRNNLHPSEVTAKSGHKAWWKCPVADDHEWEAVIASRSDGRGCPFCAGRRLAASTSLERLFPAVADQWHHDKNHGLSPVDILPGSSRKVWWKCPVADDHEWMAKVVERTSSGRGCPCCAGKLVVPSNCLTTMRPDLVSLWHPVRNLAKPDKIVAGSSRKVWWKCPVADDHEWEATVSNVAKGSRCPCCHGLKVVNSNCLATLFPMIAEEWCQVENGELSPWDVTPNSTKKAWWRCPKDASHRWLASVNNRVASGSGCPICRDSKGEAKIRKFLRDKNLRFTQELMIPECRNARPLPFDFAVHLHTGTVLVEYHGIQHYESIPFFESQRGLGLAYRKKCDKIKDLFCKNHGIRLLVIPYWKADSIPKILSAFLGS